MTTKGFPATIFFSLGALGLLSFIGVFGTASGLGYWYSLSNDPFPINLLGRAAMYGLVPMLAIIDIVRRKKSGRYLAILPLLCASAAMFHAFIDTIFLPLTLRSGRPAFVMPILAISFGFAVLAGSMGFSGKVDAFFETELSLGDDHSTDIRNAVTCLDEGKPDREAEPNLEQNVLGGHIQPSRTFWRCNDRSANRTYSAVQSGHFTA